MYRKFMALLCVLMLGALLLGGCAETGDMLTDNNQNENNANGNGEEEDEVLTPEEEIDQWVEDSREMFLAQSRELDGQQYILVTYGQKETDGYTVEIIEVEVGEKQVSVEVMFTDPAEDAQVTDEVSFPYDLEMIPATGLPVEVTARGAQKTVPHIIDIEYLQPIVASSEHIKIFKPAPDEQVGYRFAVKGIINEHEGNVQYKLLDGSDTVLINGITGMMASEDWKYFVINVEVPPEVADGERLLMELCTQSAKDGALQDVVQVKLILQE